MAKATIIKHLSALYLLLSAQYSLDKILRFERYM